MGPICGGPRINVASARVCPGPTTLPGMLSLLSGLRFCPLSISPLSILAPQHRNSFNYRLLDHTRVV